MKRKTRTALVAMLFSLSGCVGYRVAGEIQSGRTELMNGDPKVAVSHFQRAAELDPGDVENSNLLDEGVWTYLGRAYYKAGNLSAAKRALEEARSRYDQDYLARLYLGLVLSREGHRQSALKEIDAGLTGLRNSLDYIEKYRTVGEFWDPGRVIGSEIERDLAMISGKDIDWPKLIASGEWIGTKIEEEVDLARWDERHDRLQDGGGDRREISSREGARTR